MAKLFSGGRKVVGMLHLLALPGSPKFASLEAVEEAALRDAQALSDGGVDAILVENFGDAPFYPSRGPRHTLAFFTGVAKKLRDAVDMPIGINVLRNDSLAAMAIASAVGAEFIRVNVLSGSYITDQGLIEGEAHRLLRLRRELGSSVEILADASVKHAAPLADFSLEEEVENLTTRALADGVVITGKRTGEAPRAEWIRRSKASTKPVLAGSGLKPENIELLKLADGAIVGTYFKERGMIEKPVDELRVKRFMHAVTVE